MGSPERKGFVECVLHYLVDTRSTEALQLLLTKEEAWKQLVEEAGLSRAEEASLHEALAEIIPDPDVEDEDELQNDRQERKSFLDACPQVKLELEERIRKLHTLADKIDKVHRDCTITHVVASSTSAASGVLTILGLALAPVTAEFSLGLSATALGLGAAAAVTSVSATIVEKVSMMSAEAEASELLSISKDTVKAIKEVVEKSTPRLISVSKNSFRNLEVIKKSIDAIKLTKAKPHLAINAKYLINTGRVSTQSTKQVEKTLGDTALAMTKGAWITGVATAGFFLVLDVVGIIVDTMHLQEGAKAESAAKLRQKAQDLEQKLQELIWVHYSLTQ
ncbi:apolipoprotein L3-like [Microtus oregoni]|uniref:apolipoprotein L3-like n=1 Tax=Microtus oregoni TaxID=111838 RepID=UPI001BB1EE1D|nr:apolipoprotein L3-like [Microtus oregoni]